MIINLYVMENIIEIKTFSPEMHDFVCRLTRQLSPNREGPSEEEFRDILSSESAHLLVLQNDEEMPVGMLTAGIYRTPTGHKAWIEDVVIDDAYRGHGYGKKIVEYAVDFIRGLGADTISLTSNPSRVAANQLYRATGFDRYETNVYKMRL